MGIGDWIELGSFFLAIIALVFTLYFWLLDQLREEETKFIEGKEEQINKLKDYRDKIKELNKDTIAARNNESPENQDQISKPKKNNNKKGKDNNNQETQASNSLGIESLNGLVEYQKQIEKVNYILDVLVRYRFWNRNAPKEEFDKIKEFHTDSKYLSSTLLRYIENLRIEKDNNSQGADNKNPEKKDDSLIAIKMLKTDSLEEITDSYVNGLNYIIFYLQDWK